MGVLGQQSPIKVDYDIEEEQNKEAGLESTTNKEQEELAKMKISLESLIEMYRDFNSEGEQKKQEEKKKQRNKKKRSTNKNLKKSKKKNSLIIIMKRDQAE